MQIPNPYLRAEREAAFEQLGWSADSRPDHDCIFFACPGDVGGLRNKVIEWMLEARRNRFIAPKPYVWAQDKGRHGFPVSVQAQEALPHPFDPRVRGLIFMVGERLGTRLPDTLPCSLSDGGTAKKIADECLVPEWPEGAVEQDALLEKGCFPLTGSTYELLNGLEAAQRFRLPLRVLFLCDEATAQRPGRGDPEQTVFGRNRLWAAVADTQRDDARRQRWMVANLLHALMRHARIPVAFTSHERVVDPEFANTPLARDALFYAENDRDASACLQSFLTDRFGLEVHGDPIKFLEHYDVDDFPVFFGRERDVEEALAQLGRLDQDSGRCLHVVAWSGTGKSSFLRAGLIGDLHYWTQGDFPYCVVRASDIRQTAESTWPVSRADAVERLTADAGDELPQADSDVLSRATLDAFLDVAWQALVDAAGWWEASAPPPGRPTATDPAEAARTLDATARGICRGNGRLILAIDQLEEVLQDLRRPEDVAQWHALLGFLDAAMGCSSLQLLIACNREEARADAESDHVDASAGPFLRSLFLRKHRFLLGAPAAGARERLIRRTFQKAGFELAEDLVESLQAQFDELAEGAEDGDDGAQAGRTMPLLAATLALLYERAQALRQSASPGGEVRHEDNPALTWEVAPMVSEVELTLAASFNLQLPAADEVDEPEPPSEEALSEAATADAAARPQRITQVQAGATAELRHAIDTLGERAIRLCRKRLPADVSSDTAAPEIDALRKLLLQLVNLDADGGAARPPGRPQALLRPRLRTAALHPDDVPGHALVGAMRETKLLQSAARERMRLAHEAVSVHWNRARRMLEAELQDYDLLSRLRSPAQRFAAAADEAEGEANPWRFIPPADVDVLRSRLGSFFERWAAVLSAETSPHAGALSNARARIWSLLTALVEDAALNGMEWLDTSRAACTLLAQGELERADRLLEGFSTEEALKAVLSSSEPATLSLLHARPWLITHECDGRPVLAWLASAGWSAAVRHCLATPVNWGGRPGDFSLALLFAAAMGRSAVVEMLLDDGRADPGNETGGGAFALLLAAQNGHAEVVHLLLADGRAAPEQKTEDGALPLLQAAQNGHTEVVQLLLADGRARPDQVDKQDGTFPLLQAAQSGHAEVVQLLLADGRADPDHEREHDGAFPLLVAAENGRAGVVQLLLADGRARPDRVRKNYGSFPLLMAAQNGHTEVVQLLLADGRARPDQVDKQDGTFPLLQAAQNGHAEVVHLLLADGRARPDQVNKQDGTFPLLLAAQNGHAEVVRLLLADERADPDYEHKESGAFPLLLAAQNGHAEVVHLLLADGRARPDQVNKQGGTFPLLLAAQNGHAEVVRLLLADGRARPDRVDKEDGTFPLLLAAHTGRVNAARALAYHHPWLLLQTFKEQSTAFSEAFEQYHREQHLASPETPDRPTAGNSSPGEPTDRRGTLRALVEAWLAWPEAPREELNAVLHAAATSCPGELVREVFLDAKRFGAVTLDDLSKRFDTPQIVRSGQRALLNELMLAFGPACAVQGGVTLLHSAASGNQVDCAEVLMERAPALIGVGTRSNGFLPVHTAVHRNQPRMFERLVDELPASLLAVAADGRSVADVARAGESKDPSMAKQITRDTARLRITARDVSELLERAPAGPLASVDGGAAHRRLMIRALVRGGRCDWAWSLLQESQRESEAVGWRLRCRCWLGSGPAGGWATWGGAAFLLVAGLLAAMTVTQSSAVLLAASLLAGAAGGLLMRIGLMDTMRRIRFRRSNAAGDGSLTDEALEALRERVLSLTAGQHVSEAARHGRQGTPETLAYP